MPKVHKFSTRPIQAVLSLGLAAGLVAGIQPAASAAPAVLDPERNSQTATSWGRHSNVSPATIKDYVDKGNRIVDLEVRTGSLRFDVAYVKNSATYQRDWWWYYGQTGPQVQSKLAAKKARLIDIEPYSTSQGTRYAVVMVKNSGVAAKSWGWHYNVPLATITKYAKDNNMRVVDVDRHASGNRFSAVYVKNTGVDTKTWWHYYNVTSTTAVQLAKKQNARPINLERLPNGHYDVVLQKEAGEDWGWHFGVTAKQIDSYANDHHARVFQVKGYTENGQTRYDALYIGNSGSA